MTDYPDFIDGEPCKMCGSVDVCLQYRKAGSDSSSSYSSTRYWGEAMRHGCNTCKYAWLTKTKSSTKEVK